MVLACLIPQDVNPQLKGHLVGALNNGSTEDEVKAVRDVVVKGTLGDQKRGSRSQMWSTARDERCSRRSSRLRFGPEPFQANSKVVCEASGMKMLDDQSLDGWGWREPVAPVKLPKSSKL